MRILPLIPPLIIYSLWSKLFLLAETSDTTELFRLLQLVVCCAVNGENKEEYIKAILSMEHAVQQAIMVAIQEVRRGYALFGLKKLHFISLIYIVESQRKTLLRNNFVGFLLYN